MNNFKPCAEALDIFAKPGFCCKNQEPKSMNIRLKDGTYQAVIDECILGQHPDTGKIGACYMYDVKLHVIDPETGYRVDIKAQFYFHRSCFWAINVFLEKVLGKESPENYKEAFEMCVGRRVGVEIYTRKYRGRDGREHMIWNSVKSWQEPIPEPEPQPQQDFYADDMYDVPDEIGPEYAYEPGSNPYQYQYNQSRTRVPVKIVEIDENDDLPF